MISMVENNNTNLKSGEENEKIFNQNICKGL